MCETNLAARVYLRTDLEEENLNGTINSLSVMRRRDVK
jgi:hypothetical protein